MATNFNPATKISVSGPLSISDKRSADMPLDIRGRIETLNDITTIPFAWEGMLVYVRDTKKYYKVTSLANRTVGGVAIPYYPATWIEFGSGGGTPSPTPSHIDAGDVSYSSSGTFSNDTVGKELQSLANDILGLAEDIHNLSGDIGTLSSLNTENKQDLVAAINEVLSITDDKVAGIKVQGETSVLPMDGNGIVTIPAGGGGGTGTITGATVGSSQVPEVGGILQFQAYPTVPITSIETSDHTTLTPNNGLITLPAIPADQSTRIKNIENSIAQMGNNKPIVIPPSAVELPVSTSNPDYIDYDSDTTYVMNIDGTQVATIHYPYVDNNNNYVAFKAIDRDLYYAYIVSVVSDAERYTYSNQYTWSTLPADAKSKFESGIYAIKQVINDDGTLPEKKWYKNIPSAFVDKNNFPLRTRRIDETISSSVIDVLLVKNDRLNKIYRYAFNVSHNAWVLINGGCYTKDDATTGENYTKYDAYFDRQPASNVSFDDQNINIGADNVQDAIRIAFTNIQSTTCTLNLTVYKDSAILANKSVHIDVTYQGVVSSILSGDYTTSSQGLISVSLPLGSVYTITFSDETNYRKPDTINGIADDTIKNITVLYEPVAENERVILICNIRGTTSSITANNKIAYIHYTNSDYTVNLSNDPEWTITFNNVGMPSSIVNEGVIKENILIPFGTYYTVELEDWDTSLQPDEQSFSKSPIFKTRALNESKVINLTYSYLLSGMFVVLKDDNDSAFGYTSYKVIDVDTQNDITTILINDVEYNIKYTAGIGIQKSIRGANDYEVWIASADMDTNIIGVGIRTQRLNDAPLLAQEGLDQGYNKCSFMICKITYPTNGYTMDIQPITDVYDGKYGTINAVNSENYSQCANAAYNITKVTGNHTQHGFLPSSCQWDTIFPSNYLKIKSILASLNINISISGNYWLATRFHDAGGSGNPGGMAWGNSNGVIQNGNYNDATVSKAWKCFPIFLFN